MIHEDLEIEAGLEGRLWRYSGQAPLIAPHIHEELEVNLVANGRAVYLVEDARVELERGSLLWLFPEEKHVIVERDSEFVMWIGVFRPHLVSQVAEALRCPGLLVSRNEQPLLKQLRAQVEGRLRQVFESGEESENCIYWYNALLSYLLGEVWKATQAEDIHGEARSVHPAVRRAAQFLQDHVEAVSLEEIARASGLNRWNLSKLFKEQLGISLTCYRQNLAIDRFLLLCERKSGSNFTETALEAGFGSYPQFHRAFRRVIGCGPREYFAKRR